ncbi:nicotinamide-nucleotide amidase [Endothiovibrio diazotrophicus]
MMGDDGLAALAAKVGEALLARGWMVATAESCTGGWVAKALTDVAGSSAYVDRGFVTYTNEAKEEMLGVPAETVARFGAVSGETVRAMAEGALRGSRAGIAVAISGVAGPGGGSAEKPVGTVWFAWATAAGCAAERQWFDGDREAVRRQAVLHALQGVLTRL